MDVVIARCRGVLVRNELIAFCINFFEKNRDEFFPNFRGEGVANGSGNREVDEQVFGIDTGVFELVQPPLGRARLGGSAGQICVDQDRADLAGCVGVTRPAAVVDLQEGADLAARLRPAAPALAGPAGAGSAGPPGKADQLAAEFFAARRTASAQTAGGGIGFERVITHFLSRWGRPGRPPGRPKLP